MSKKTKSPAPEFKEGQCVWISKWALTDGIKSATFSGRKWENASIYSVVVDDTKTEHLLWEAQVHATEEQAKASANAQRDSRIKSLQKQIAKLEQLKF